MPLRHLIFRSVKHAAGKKLGEKTREAAEQAVESSGQADRAEQPPPVEVGVVFALGEESGGFEDLLEHKTDFRGDAVAIRQGELDGRQVAVVRSGPGREAAAQATEILLDGHRPRWVIAAGFAGGLVDELARHDLLMVDHLVDTSGNRLAIDLSVDRAWLASAAGVHLGRLLTADRLVRLPEEKRRLAEQHGAAAVDMETFAAAEVCTRREVRFLAVRIVSDPVDEELPKDVEKLLGQETTAGRLGAAVGSIWRRPSSLKDMYRLKENALVASDKLAKFLAGMIGGLPAE